MIVCYPGAVFADIQKPFQVFALNPTEAVVEYSSSRESERNVAAARLPGLQATSPPRREYRPSEDSPGRFDSALFRPESRVHYIARQLIDPPTRPFPRQIPHGTQTVEGRRTTLVREGYDQDRPQDVPTDYQNLPNAKRFVNPSLHGSAYPGGGNRHYYGKARWQDNIAAALAEAPNRGSQHEEEESSGVDSDMTDENENEANYTDNDSDATVDDDRDLDVRDYSAPLRDGIQPEFCSASPAQWAENIGYTGQAAPVWASQPLNGQRIMPVPNRQAAQVPQSTNNLQRTAVPRVLPGVTTSTYLPKGDKGVRNLSPRVYHPATQILPPAGYEVPTILKGSHATHSEFRVSHPPLVDRILSSTIEAASRPVGQSDKRVTFAISAFHVPHGCGHSTDT
eukprot:GHVT01049565.1.p1 GENE.GHVT01049565.1~~GHVT01049565.1.p1  ORF type:complete len:396 (+),score=33.61 GHVT01049565.1:169-1356(+)